MDRRTIFFHEVTPVWIIDDFSSVSAESARVSGNSFVSFCKFHRQLIIEKRSVSSVGQLSTRETSTITSTRLKSSSKELMKHGEQMKIINDEQTESWTATSGMERDSGTEVKMSVNLSAFIFLLFSLSCGSCIQKQQQQQQQQTIAREIQLNVNRTRIESDLHFWN